MIGRTYDAVMHTACMCTCPGLMEKAVSLVCHCGCAWCFHCLAEPHWPATCNQAHYYQTLVQQEGLSVSVVFVNNY